MIIKLKTLMLVKQTRENAKGKLILIRTKKK